MDLKQRAHRLLTDWTAYKSLHYSTKTEFGNAIDIEIQKDAAAQFAGMLTEALINDANERELTFIMTSFEDHLRIFKDQLTFELLKNGPHG
jgi:hypothetical protein